MISTLTEKEKMRMWHKLPTTLQQIMARMEHRRRILTSAIFGQAKPVGLNNGGVFY